MKSEKKQTPLTAEDTESEMKTEESASAPASSDAIEAPALETEASLAETQDKYLRLAAEFENFKKRTARERLDLISSANDNILLQMLDAVDNFERALGAVDEGQRQQDDNPQKLYQALHAGAKMIHQQLLGILRAHGVEEIETDGKQFDPAFHEAVVQIETDEYPEDFVAQALSKGYKRGARVLRHAKVGVASKKKQQ